MKKLILVLTLAISASISFSQSYIDFGPKFFFGPNALVNSEIMNQLSYHVDDSKIRKYGLRLNSDLQKDINETLKLFTYLK